MINTVPRMETLQAELVRLLRGLKPEQWSAPTGLTLNLTPYAMDNLGRGRTVLGNGAGVRA